MLDILQCPISGGRLQPLDAAKASELAERIQAGELVHLDGSPVRSAFESFLQAAPSKIYFPIREEIVVLLPAMAVVEAAEVHKYADRLSREESIAVMNFYDQLGWTRVESGAFVDAEINEDFRSVSKDYIRRSHLRVNEFLPTAGKYIVDVASGPVQYDEYLTYSSRFEKRICCDISFEALRLAKQRIGQRGAYIQCDITRMPLRDASIDAFVSLHTIYHLPADKQIHAFAELERITRPEGRGVVVYSWGDHSPAMRLMAAPGQLVRGATMAARSVLKAVLPNGLVQALRRRRDPAPDPSIPRPLVRAASQFCYHAHDYRWYRETVAARGGWNLHSWRSLSVEFMQRSIPDGPFGRLLLSGVSVLEARFPRGLGRVGQYPMFSFKRLSGPRSR